MIPEQCKRLVPETSPHAQPGPASSPHSPREGPGWPLVPRQQGPAEVVHLGTRSLSFLLGLNETRMLPLFIPDGFSSLRATNNSKTLLSQNNSLPQFKKFPEYLLCCKQNKTEMDKPEGQCLVIL